MYADYDFYTDNYYGNIISLADFPKYEDMASDKIYSITMGKVDRLLIENASGKLELDDSKISFNVKKSVCKIAEILYDIDKANEAYRGSLETLENGIADTSKRTVTQLSSGSESITFAKASDIKSQAGNLVALDKANLEKHILDSIRDYLGWTGLLSQAL